MLLIWILCLTRHTVAFALYFAVVDVNSLVVGVVCMNVEPVLVSAVSSKLTA